jgi:hypothetical protein
MARKQQRRRREPKTRPDQPAPRRQAFPPRRVSAPPRRVPPPPGRNERALRKRILEFAYQERFKTDIDRALRLYLGENAGQGNKLVLDEQQMPGFQEWYIFDYITSEGERAIDLFAREVGPQLPTAQQRMLDDWRRVNRCRLFEVQEVEPGVSVTVQDLLSGETLKVNDISSSYVLTRWEVMLARPLLTEGRLNFTGSMMALSPLQKPALLECARDLWETYQAQHPEASLSDFYRDRSLDLYHCQAEVLNKPPQPVLTPEGHPAVVCTARYAVIVPQAVEERLDQAEEFVYAGPASEDETALAYVWLLRGRSHVPEVPVTRGLILRSEWTTMPGEPSYRSLGDVRLWHARLELQCLSGERLEAGKALLSEVMGPLLRHLGDECRDLEDVAEQAGPPRSHDVPPEIDRALRRQIQERQRAEWLDTPLPVLGGRSPRQAAGDPALREQLDELFKAFDYVEEQKRKNGEPYLDVAEMRRELGLPPLRP